MAVSDGQMIDVKALQATVDALKQDMDEIKQAGDGILLYKNLENTSGIVDLGEIPEGVTVLGILLEFNDKSNRSWEHYGVYVRVLLSSISVDNTSAGTNNFVSVPMMANNNNTTSSCSIRFFTNQNRLQANGYLTNNSQVPIKAVWGYKL